MRTSTGAASEQDLASRQGRLLFAYLTLERAEPVPRERLASLLWPDTLPPAWEKSLVAVISRLRRALTGVGLPGEAIASAFGCYQLRLPEDVSVDVEVAEHSLQRALDAARSGDHSVAEEAALAAAAIARHSFLPGEEGEWVEGIRARLHDVLVRSLDCCAATAADPATRVRAAEEALAAEPFHEPAFRLLMHAHDMAGNRAAALQAYERCRFLLAEDLGTNPSLETERVYLRILRDEGRVSPSVPGGNVAPYATSFLGREAEMRDLTGLIAGGGLVTITGHGGCGKTRLAVEFARERAPSFTDGVWVVALGSLADPGPVARTVATAILVREEREDILASIVEAIGTRSMLIVLDNCEHVLAEASRVAGAIAGRCPNAALLATSRRALGIPTERVFPLAPLPLPAGRDASNPAVRLFCERAETATPGITTSFDSAIVADIARATDGLPLAIELAAARTRVLGLDQIRERMSERLVFLGGRGEGRHATLRSTIAWSHDVLDEPARILFRRVAVFDGGFDLEAAEQVCSFEPLRREDVVDLVTELVDASLLVVAHSDGRARYRFLDTVAEFAAAMLDAAGEAAECRDRHLSWACSFAEDAGRWMENTIDAAWLKRAEDELDNVRAALRWATTSGRRDDAMRIVSALWIHWRTAGYADEGLDWFERGRAADGPVDERAEAGATLAAAIFANHLGRPSRSRPLGEQALDAWRVIGDEAQIARCLVWFGVLEADLGRRDRARAHWQEAIAHARRGDATRHLLVALGNLAELEMREGNLELARALLTDSIAIADPIRHSGGVQARAILAAVEALEGDTATARLHLDESLPALRANSPLHYHAALNILASVALREDRVEEALEVLGTALSAAASLRFSQGVAGTLKRVALVAARHKYFVEAARLLGAVQAIHDAVPEDLDPLSEDDRRAAMSLIADHPGFTAAFTAGRLLSPDDAASEAARLIRDLASTPAQHR